MSFLGIDPRAGKIMDFIGTKSDYEKITIWNNYCRLAHRQEDFIFRDSEFNYRLKDLKPVEIASKFFFGGGNPTHDFWWLNGYENIETSDSLTYKECPYDSQTIAEYAVNFNEDFGYDAIREMLKMPRPV